MYLNSQCLIYKCVDTDVDQSCSLCFVSASLLLFTECAINCHSTLKRYSFSDFQCFDAVGCAAGRASGL